MVSALSRISSIGMDSDALGRPRGRSGFVMSRSMPCHSSIFILTDSNLVHMVRRMTQAPHVPVLIAGGGPTGLVLAAELARHGVASLLAERNEHTTLFPK